MDENNGVVTEAGVTGELMIGGIGVALGYLRRPTITAGILEKTHFLFFLVSKITFFCGRTIFSKLF